MQPRMTRNRVLVPADEGDEKRSASYQMKRLQFDRKLEVLKTYEFCAASLSNPCRLKNKWHPGLRKRPFSIFLSDEENDTDEEFALRRAEACKEYRKVVESTLDHLKSSLCSRDCCRTPDTTLSVDFSHQGTPGTAEQRTPRFGRTQISYSRLLIHHRHGIGYAH